MSVTYTNMEKFVMLTFNILRHNESNTDKHEMVLYRIGGLHKLTAV
jgi:hypothetical protein